LPQKLWDLESKSLLTTFQFPHAVTQVTWDAAERLFFAASGDGSIHQVNLYRTRIDKTHGRVAEGIGGAGVSDTLSVAENERDASNRRLVTVGCVNPSLRYRTATAQSNLIHDLLFREPITALCLSLTGAMLLAGTAVGNVHVYDVPSHQLLRTINAHSGPGLAVTHLTTLLKPPDLVGHVRLDGDKDGRIPVRPIMPFQRMREARPREAHEVTMMLPHAQKVCSRLLESKRNTPSSAVLFCFYDRPRRTIPSPRIRARSFSATGNSSSGLLDLVMLRGMRTMRLLRRN
jgi:pre-rRNA-processing protein IPI3